MNAKTENGNFGLPPVTEAAASETREDRLRAKAAKIVAEESDEEMLARLVIEERAKRDSSGIPLDTAGFPEDYDKIVIAAGRDANDLSYVPLGYGGFIIKAPRDEEVILPHVFVTECLDHAVETLTIPVKGASGAPIGIVLRNAQRFPYQFKGKATTAEYKAYQAAQKAKAERQTALAA